jgi:3'-phosphoadenosine 5'-phosphosulfate sulfotransferase (PAPS reductase)/FAD synthetase
MVQVSFSGGRSSAMMAKIMLENPDVFPREELLFTFANTGKEMPQTLDFVNECDKRWQLGMVWVEYCPVEKFRVVSYETASRNGEPFEAITERINNRYLPNRVQRFCTTDLKVKPMAKYIRSLGIDYWDAAIGIRYDEPNRYHKMKNAKRKDRWEYIFPLWDFRITKKEVAAFWQNQGFDLMIPSEHGNCDFCFMKGLRKKVAQARLIPERLQWWIDMEAKAGSRFHADYKMSDILSLSKNPQLFDNFDEPEISCFCGD